MLRRLGGGGGGGNAIKVHRFRGHFADFMENVYFYVPTSKFSKLAVQYPTINDCVNNIVAKQQNDKSC